MRLKVRDLMTSDSFEANEDESITEVLLKLSKQRKTLIICVVDETRKLKGIITPKRLLKAVQVSEFGASRYPSLDWATVLGTMASSRARDIMGPPISVKPDDYLEDAINIMTDKNVYTLPVVDQEGKILGRLGFYKVISRYASSLEARSAASSGSSD
jgi:CBS-domain-containing membrane protein